MPRRIVTGLIGEKSVFSSDGSAPTAHDYQSIPGFHTAILWASSQAPELRDTASERAPPGTAVVPTEAGASTFVLVQIPPDSVTSNPGFDPVAAMTEQAAWLPGMNEHFDPDLPGMHRTDTLDYCIVIQGEVWLELDDGVARLLQAGDVVIQRGTRHAWRNRGETPALMAYVLIGARALKSTHSA